MAILNYFCDKLRFGVRPFTDDTKQMLEDIAAVEELPAIKRRAEYFGRIRERVMAPTFMLEWPSLNRQFGEDYKYDFTPSELTVMKDLQLTPPPPPLCHGDIIAMGADGLWRRATAQDIVDGRRVRRIPSHAVITFDRVTWRE